MGIKELCELRRLARLALSFATSPPELSATHPQLAAFVLGREATGLPDRFQFYLALYAGPLARSTGVAHRIDIATGRADTLVEVAFPPYAYVMTIDSPDDKAIETANITSAVDVGYNQTADLEMDMLVGFGHTPHPADYRTQAMVERERPRNEVDAVGKTRRLQSPRHLGGWRASRHRDRRARHGGRDEAVDHGEKRRLA